MTIKFFLITNLYVLFMFGTSDGIKWILSLYPSLISVHVCVCIAYAICHMHACTNVQVFACVLAVFFFSCFIYSHERIFSSNTLRHTVSGKNKQIALYFFGLHNWAIKGFNYTEILQLNLHEWIAFDSSTIITKCPIHILDCYVVVVVVVVRFRTFSWMKKT